MLKHNVFHDQFTKVLQLLFPTLFIYLPRISQVNLSSLIHISFWNVYAH